MKKEAKNLIEAWESLEGDKNYTPKEIEKWLIEKMKPAIDILRETFNKETEILETYKWIKIKKYKDDNTLTWEERYKKLEKHHIEETNFLIEKIRNVINNKI